MSCCPECAETLRIVLEHSVSAVAIEHVTSATSAYDQDPLDWACDLDEEDRERAREAARRMLNHVARRLEVPEL